MQYIRIAACRQMEIQVGRSTPDESVSERLRHGVDQNVEAVGRGCHAQVRLSVSLGRERHAQEYLSVAPRPSPYSSIAL